MARGVLHTRCYRYKYMNIQYCKDPPDIYISVDLLLSTSTNECFMSAGYVSSQSVPVQAADGHKSKTTQLEQRKE